MATLLLGATIVLLSPSAYAGRIVPEPDVLDADDPLVSDDLGFGDLDLTIGGPSDEDLVLAAQKVRTTVQEAPSIIFVVTKDQMRERGYRTINDVLRTVPGFEGDRWEGNGWQKESFARGLPRTILVLLNGVNIVEPIRNFTSLDRKIPLEIVERIEVTSGPGGVLWGSNALLGVVNIVTRRPDDSGFEALVGAGDGPGDRLQTKAAIGYSKRFGDDVGLYAHANFYTTNGPELTVDAQKVIGSLPEPAVDSPTLYIPEARTVSSGARSWYFNFAGRLEVGPLAFDWMVPFERDYRPIATGGAPLTVNFLDPELGGDASSSTDAISVYQLSYRDRFAGDDVGVLARAYLVSWDIEDKPFGIYPASPVILGNLGYEEDLRLSLMADYVLRPGLAVDVDIKVAEELTIVTGAEGFVDINENIRQVSWTTDTLGVCPAGFEYDAFDPHLPCKIEDLQVDNISRVIGGGFVNALWSPVRQLSLSAGVRLQASSQFDPTVLYSGGAVWNPGDKWHLKLFASSGLRPPGVLSTHVRDTTSAISFKRNEDLQAETAQSFEMEVNTTLLRDVGVIRDLYLRANGAYTLMDNVIGRPGGRFQNSEAQQIASAEAFARLRFEAGHELWANYTYTRVFDDSAPGGELRNISQHILNVGGRLRFLNDHIELMGMLTFKSEMKDPNRPPIVDETRSDYSLSCAQILALGLPSDHPLRVTCSASTLAGGVWVMAGAEAIETIKPLALLDLGVRFKDIWRDLSVAIFVHNVLDFRYYEADFFNDSRVLSRPQPKPGMSFFGQVSVGL